MSVSFCHSDTNRSVNVTEKCSKFLNLPVGEFLASKAFIFPKEGNKMPLSTDKELQARLLKEIYELWE